MLTSSVCARVQRRTDFPTCPRLWQGTLRPHTQVILVQPKPAGFSATWMEPSVSPAHIQICTGRVQSSRSAASRGPSWAVPSLWGPGKGKSRAGRQSASRKAEELSKPRLCCPFPAFAENKAHLAPQPRGHCFCE